MMKSIYMSRNLEHQMINIPKQDAGFVQNKEGRRTQDGFVSNAQNVQVFAPKSVSTPTTKDRGLKSSELLGDYNPKPHLSNPNHQKARHINMQS